MMLYSEFHENALKKPDQVAVMHPSGSISYAGLDHHARALSEVLHTHGVRPGDVVGLYLESGIDYLAALLAVNKTGAAFLPLEPSHPRQRTRQIIDTVRPAHFIGLDGDVHELKEILHGLDKAYNPGIFHVTAYTTGLDNPVLLHEGGTTGHDRAVEEDVAYLIYTSGSTGTPKIIKGSGRGLDHFIRWEIRESGLQDTVRVAQLAPLSFDVSLRDLWVPLYAGGTICIPAPDVKRNMSAFADWLEDNRISVLHIVPSLFRLLTAELGLMARPGKKTQALEHIFLAGEPLYNVDVIKWRDVAGRSIKLVNLYGPSETTLAKLFHPIGHLVFSGTREILPLGRPIDDTRVFLENEGHPCAVGEIGEIFIQTKFRSRGYYHDPVMTEEKFREVSPDEVYGYIAYSTGDLGRINQEGLIEFIGRMDHQVKVGGNRVELFEVERVLNAFPGVRQFVVTSFVNDRAETELAGYYTAASAIDPLQFRDYIKDLLPVYMHPSYYVKVDEFTLNINGKVDRKALRLPDMKQQQLAGAPCETDLELGIEKIWMGILKMDRIGRDVSFFSIGGSSLKAIQIIARIQKEFHVLIKLARFFDKPMIRDLALLVGESLEESTQNKTILN